MPIKRNPSIVSQVITELNDRIQSGKYPPGSKLPSESDLAEDLKVSRASIREALADLDAKGMLWRRQGVGTFILDSRAVFTSHQTAFTSLRTYIRQVGFEDTMEAYPPEFRTVTQKEADQFGIKVGTEIVELHRRYFADKVPVFISDYYLPLSILTKERDEIDFLMDIPEFVLEYTSDKVTAIQTRVDPYILDEEEAAKMILKSGDAVLIMHNTFHGQQGEPFFYNNLLFNNQKIGFFAFYTIY